MPVDLRRRTVKIRQVDIPVRTKGDLTAMDEQERDLHANIHDPPQQGNFTINREI